MAFLREVVSWLTTGKCESHSCGCVAGLFDGQVHYVDVDSRGQTGSERMASTQGHALTTPTVHPQVPDETTGPDNIEKLFVPPPAQDYKDQKNQAVHSAVEEPSKKEIDEEEIEFECREGGITQFARFATVPHALIISRIDKKSCFSKRKNPGIGLGNGDMIFQVNDTRKDAEAMQSAIEESQKFSRPVRLKIRRRPFSFDVDIPRVGTDWKNLGVDISPDKKPKALWVAGVNKTGLIPAWNEAHSDRLICVGDLITAIESVSEDPKKMIAAARRVIEGQVLHLRVESDVRARSANHSDEVMSQPSTCQSTSKSSNH